MEALIGILIPLLVQVESGGKVNAVGDKHKGEYLAIGVLQIHDCVIEDVNRIYGTHFKSTDRWDEGRSREICRLYLLHWGKHFEKKTGKKATIEVLARIWNGGPNGWKKKSTEQYAKKVKSLQK